MRAALAKQVPALVEPDSELLEAIMLRGREAAALALVRVEESLLLGDEVVDALQ